MVIIFPQKSIVEIQKGRLGYSVNKAGDQVGKNVTFTLTF